MEYIQIVVAPINAMRCSIQWRGLRFLSVRVRLRVLLYYHLGVVDWIALRMCSYFYDIMDLYCIEHIYIML
jgi:hypothetical protein